MGFPNGFCRILPAHGADLLQTKSHGSKGSHVFIEGMGACHQLSIGIPRRAVLKDNLLVSPHVAAFRHPQELRTIGNRHHPVDSLGPHGKLHKSFRHMDPITGKLGVHPILQQPAGQGADSTFAAVVSVSFAIMFDQPVELAIALAIPVGFVGLFFMQVRQLYSALWIPFIDNLIAQDKEKQFNFWTFFCSFSGNLLQPAILFVGLSLGGEGLQQVMDALPQYIMTGMQAAGGMLPAIGLGILINMIWEKKSVVYFLLGFVLVIYFNVPIVAMAFIAVFLAAVDLYRNQDNISLRQEIAQMRLHGVDPDSADREEEEFFG